HALADLTGDPWNGRTLEWATSSPPAPYNFAVLPQVRDLDAFYQVKLEGTAYARPERYEPIVMPKNSAVGVLCGALGFLFGFGMVWYIWWLVALCLVGALVVLTIRACNDDTDFVLSAEEVEAIETARLANITPERMHDLSDLRPEATPLPAPGRA
ncbi:MAG: cytochrome o ubiquinol oxidase subunit I, partial [Pseudomonadota bacterium]